jgi:hypothetical protein
MLLSRESILQAPDLPQERVHVPEWGGDVILRALNAEDMARWLQMARKASEKEDADQQMMSSIWLLNFAMVDENGERIFREDDTSLARKSPQVIVRLAETVMRLSAARQEEIEELEKNSASAQSGASVSG